MLGGILAERRLFVCGDGYGTKALLWTRGVNMKQGLRQWVREALGGAILGIIGALACSIVAGRCFGPVGPEEAFIGLFTGTTLGYILGVSLGVYLVGRLSGEKEHSGSRSEVLCWEAAGLGCCRSWVFWISLSIWPFLVMLLR